MDRKPNLKAEIHDCNFSSTDGLASSFYSTPISIYTPTGGSSPPLYTDSASFDPYFSQSSSFNFEYKPASSIHLSGYPFSLDLASATSVLVDSAPCYTPLRCNTHGGYSIFAQENPMLHYTPPTSADFISFQDHFMSTQFESLAHSVFGPSPSNGFEGTSMCAVLDSSPLQFSEQRARPAPRLSVMTDSSQGGPSPFDAGLVSPRQQIDLAQGHRKSTALQRLQRATTRPQPTTSRTKASKKPVEGLRKINKRVVQKNNWCTMGCKGRGFSRKEHLTRHIKDFHLRLNVIECPCCPEDNRMIFVGRRDNFMTHLALHITGEGRVPFHPQAAAIWEGEKQKCRPRALKPDTEGQREPQLGGAWDESATQLPEGSLRQTSRPSRINGPKSPSPMRPGNT